MVEKLMAIQMASSEPFLNFFLGPEKLGPKGPPQRPPEGQKIEKNFFSIFRYFFVVTYRGMLKLSENYIFNDICLIFFKI